MFFLFNVCGFCITLYGFSQLDAWRQERPLQMPQMKWTCGFCLAKILECGEFTWSFWKSEMDEMVCFSSSNPKSCCFAGWPAPFPWNHGWNSYKKQVHPLVYFGLLNQIHGETSLGNLAWAGYDAWTLFQDLGIRWFPWSFQVFKMKGNLPNVSIHKAWCKFGLVGGSGESWRREICLFPSTYAFWTVALGLPNFEGIQSVVLPFCKWKSSGLGHCCGCVCGGRGSSHHLSSLYWS